MLFTVFGFYSSDNDDPNNYEFNPHPYGVVNRKDAYYDGQNDLVLTIPDIGSGWERNDIEDHINEARGVVFDAKVIIRIIYITRTI